MYTEQKNDSSLEKERKYYLRMKRRIFAAFERSDYALLSKELTLSPSQQLDSFFNSEGSSVLNYAIVQDSAEPLRFIVNHISKYILKNLLEVNNFEFLKNFIYAEKMLEISDQSTPELRLARIEKFRLLIEIDPERVEKFMDECCADRLFNPILKKDIDDSRAQFKAMVRRAPSI
jgi:hypothetical protein